jgi:hypothetical protein
MSPARRASWSKLLLRASMRYISNQPRALNSSTIATMIHEDSVIEIPFCGVRHTGVNCRLCKRSLGEMQNLLWAAYA